MFNQNSTVVGATAHGRQPFCIINKILRGAVTFAFLLSVAASANERFGGIGLTVAQLFDPSTAGKIGELVVLDVMQGTDAHAKRIQRGDIITKVDRESTKGKDFHTLITQNLRGAVGSEVELEIRRAGVPELITVKVRRGEIKYPG